MGYYDFSWVNKTFPRRGIPRFFAGPAGVGARPVRHGSMGRHEFDGFVAWKWCFWGDFEAFEPPSTQAPGKGRKKWRKKPDGL